MHSGNNCSILFKIVPIFIGFVFVVIICWWVFLGVVFFKAGKEIDKRGVKSIVFQIWNGSENKDLSADTQVKIQK